MPLRLCPRLRGNRKKADSLRVKNWAADKDRGRCKLTFFFIFWKISKSSKLVSGGPRTGSSGP